MTETPTPQELAEAHADRTRKNLIAQLRAFSRFSAELANDLETDYSKVLSWWQNASSGITGHATEIERTMSRAAALEELLTDIRGAAEYEARRTKDHS